MIADPHPLLDSTAFRTSFPGPIGETNSPEWLVDLLRLDATAPVSSDNDVRKSVRDMLRHGGYKPTGRGKPASEYLIRAAGDGSLRSINPAVDVCNAVSLHSGLPISVIDLDRADPPFRIGVAEPGTEYVFNPAGQTIRVDGLLCLFDERGPCANGVKDSQRTKTGEQTRHTLSVIWGTLSLEGRTSSALAWYRELLARLGAATEVLAPSD